MNFLPVTKNNLSLLSRHIAGAETLFADMTLGYLYMWADFYRITFGTVYGVPFLSATDEVADERDAGAELHRVYAPASPIKGHEAEITEALHRETHGDVTLSALTEEQAMAVCACYPGRATCTYSDAESDYLYSAQSLSTFAGKKLAAKRNHIHAFLNTYEQYTFREITENDTEALLSFYRDYRLSEEDDSPGARREGAAAERLIRAMREAECIGFVLEVNGDIIGFSIGEIRRGVFYMHVEKARREIRGAYPLLVREAVSRVAADIRYVNREEDDGDEGLRRSKESYRPEALLCKYKVTVRFPDTDNGI